MVADSQKRKTKQQKTGKMGSLRKEDCKEKKQDFQPKLKSAKKKKTQAHEKSKSPVFKTKSPRNKYKHLAMKKQDRSGDKTNLCTKMEIGTIEKATDSKKDLGGAENPSVITKDVMLVKKLKRKKLKSNDMKVSSQKSGKPESAVKQTKRKRKRKKKNNPKKNKYRHLVLLKYGEQGVSGKDVATKIEEQQLKPARKSLTSFGRTQPFDVTRLKQALVTSVNKSDNQHEDKTTQSTQVATKQMKTEMKREKPKKRDREMKTGSTLKDKVTAKLSSARFRYLNEQLYTQTGQESYRLFAEDKEAFRVYHDGFQSQVEKWPSNPLDSIIKYISNK